MQNASRGNWPQFSAQEQTLILHKLGNLTPLSQEINTELSNKSFDDKKKIIEEKLGSSIMEVSKQVLELDDWNLAAFLKRHEELISKLANR